MKTLGIIGSGDLGQQIAHFAIHDKHYDQVIFIDDFAKENYINGFEIIGTTNNIKKLFNENKFDELIIGIGYKHLHVRKKLFDEFYGTIPFGKIIHSTTWVDKTAKINDGCVIYPCCVIDANVTIGFNSIINISSVIAHDSKIDKHCFLSPRVAIAGFTKINECCIIGINSTIIDNISIQSNTQIGGGSVVIKNIEKGGLYVGNPVRFIR